MVVEKSLEITLPINNNNKKIVWCFFANKVPIWEIIERRNVEGPTQCALCKQSEETIPHLFINFPFSSKTWAELNPHFNQSLEWSGPPVEEAWKSWVASLVTMRYCALPLISIWGIWFARNREVFKDKPTIPEIVAQNRTNILSYFPQEKNTSVPYIMSQVVINKQTPWDYFNGASQNEVYGGGGAFLHMTENLSYKIQMDLGRRSNNYAEICALKLLLYFFREKNCTQLHIFGDSMLIINQINKVQFCHNVLLNSILTETQRILEELDNFSCRHVYKEQNVEVDQVSKLGLTLPHR